jgi:photosystem II stability/assembly factor-like uncharacterized protein
MSNWSSGIAVKCIFLIILFLHLDFQFLSAQWIKQSPIPTGQDITGVCFVNPETGWIFGGNGTVLRTNDGGITWTDQSLPSGDMISCGLFLDLNHGWIALSDEYHDNKGRIYGTIDGGYTWHLQFMDNNCAIRDMCFLNKDTGWALAYYREVSPVPLSRNFIMKTVDGGNNWLIISFLQLAHFRKMDFINDTIGYIAGAGLPNLMKTVDGGVSWTASPHASNGSLTDILFTDIENGYTCGNNFYYTHNSGASWGFTYCYYTNGVGMYDAFNGWTFTIDKVFKVTNGGDNVDYQFSVEKSIIAGISVVDSTNAWIVGRNVMILATHDGSVSWQEISNGTHHSLHSLFFINQDEGWAGGDDRTLLHTQDGGKHWTFCNVDASPGAISDIQFINRDTGWFVNGDVYLTTNNGLSWSQASGLSNPVSDVYFPDPQLGWCVGPEGRLFKSVNGGNDWEEKNSGTEKDLHAVYFIDENLGWIAGDGIIKKTTDGGENWDERYIGPAHFLKIQFLDESSGYIIAGGLYLKTGSGGEFWDIVIPGGMTGPDSLKDICFIDQNVGYLSGNDFLLRTTDGGANWHNDPGFPAMQPIAIFFVNEDKGWIVGEDGAIYQTESGGSFSIDDPEDDVRSSPYVIFPNPSGENISINYKLDNQEDIEIGIYTLQGTKTGFYKETGKSPGNYSFNWVPGNLPPGIYLFKIRIGDFTGSEKIVYIK